MNLYISIMVVVSLTVGRGVGPGSRSRRWADGSRPRGARQTEPEGCRERTAHCLHRRPLVLHDRHAAEEPAQVHRSHRGRELPPAPPPLHGNNALSSCSSCGPIAPSAGALTRCFLRHRCSPCSPSRGKPWPSSPVPSTLQTSR